MGPLKKSFFVFFLIVGFLLLCTKRLQYSWPLERTACKNKFKKKKSKATRWCLFHCDFIVNQEQFNGFLA